MEGGRSERLNKKRKRKGLFIKYGLALAALLILAAAGFYVYVMQTIDISQLDNRLLRPTEIYDQDNKLASTVTSNKAEGVSIKQIPETVQEAVVAIEDHRFYKHHGIDYQGILRAAGVNLKAGGIVEGGSTITQQLIKVTLLDSERTYKRKAAEFLLAKKVEKEYTKEEILEMYLNRVYFGHGAWGINRAAEVYFGKDVENLSLSEAAVLAGLINRPSKLDPYTNEEGAIERRNLVLKRMQTAGYISSGEAEKAKNTEIALSSKDEKDPYKGKYPYYVDHVLSEAMDHYNLSLDELLTRGYKIYTSLNQKTQQAVEQVYSEDVNFPKGTSSDPVQSAAVLIDPKTGGIAALQGGRGEHLFMGYNRATQMKTSPGSSIKPLAVYTPALEEGYDITDELVDEKMTFGDYEPSNSNGEYKGKVPMYEAVLESINVPTVWLLNEIGIQKGIDSLEAFGIPVEKEDRNLSIALGGMSKGVSPLDMAEAYSAFSNNGKRITSHAILKIEDADGKEMDVWEKEETKAASPEAVKKMNTMLLANVKYGTGTNAAVSGYEIAGKTGSSQVPIEGISGVKDQWFTGYSPSLTGAVWVGYDKTDKDHYLTTYGSEGAAKVFQKIMDLSLQGQPADSFNVDDIGTLLEEQGQEEEKSDWYDFWREQKDKFKNGWDRLRNRWF